MSGVDKILVVGSMALCVGLWLLAYRRPKVGLLLTPVASASIALAAAAAGLPPVGALILAVAVVILSMMVVLARPQDPAEDPRPRAWARFILGVLVIGSVVSVAAGLGIWPGPLAAAALVYFCSTIGLAFESSRNLLYAVISALAAGVRQGLPLPMALESAAHGRRDMAGYVMRQIGYWLVQGHRLSESIKRGFPRFPIHQYHLIAAAEHMGQLPCTLEAIQYDSRSGRSGGAWSTRSFQATPSS